MVSQPAVYAFAKLAGSPKVKARKIVKTSKFNLAGIEPNILLIYRCPLKDYILEEWSSAFELSKYPNIFLFNINNLKYQKYRYLKKSSFNK
jgi:hypothetical protein